MTAASLVAAERERQAKQQETELRQQAEETQKQAESNLMEAQRQRQRAEDNFTAARKAVDDSFTKISENQLLQVPGMQPLRRDLLQSALTFYQGFLKEHGDDPALRGELAAAYLRVGTIRGELGEWNEALKVRDQGVALYQALWKDAPESVEWQNGLAQCYLTQGRYDEAIALWEKLIQPGQPRFQKELGETYNGRGSVSLTSGKFGESLQDYQHALTIRELLVRLQPDDAGALYDLSQTLNNIGVLLDRNGRLTESLALYYRAAEYGGEAFTRAPHTIGYGTSLALYHSNAGITERRLGHADAAVAAYERGLEVRRKLVRDNPAVPSLHATLLMAYRELAHYHREQKQTRPYEKTLRLTREAIERMPSDGPDALFNLATARVGFSMVLVEGKTKLTAQEKAEQKHEEDLAVEAFRQAIAAGFRDRDRLQSARVLNALRQRDDFRALEAELLARPAATPPDKSRSSTPTLAERRKSAPDDPRLRADLSASQHAIGLVLFNLGKIDEARKHFQQAVAFREELANKEPKNAPYQADLTVSRRALETAVGLMNARQLIGQNRAKEAKEALAKIEALKLDSAAAWKESGRLRFALGQTDKAADDFQKAVELLGDKAEPSEPAGSEAEKLFARLAGEVRLKKLTADIEGDPEDRGKRWQRGEWYARRARWKAAAADFKIALEREPSPTDMNWLHVAPALVAAGDREGYERLCGQMRKEIRDPQDAFTAERTAKTQLLLPRADEDTQWAGRLADRAVEVGKNNPWAPYFIFCKGLADYRRGDFAAPAKELDALLTQIASKEGLNSPSRLVVSREDLSVCCRAVLAMALFRRGEAKAAQTHLAEGAKLLRQHIPDLTWFPVSTGQYHHDWLIAWLLHREAQSLIEGKKAEPKERHAGK